MKKLLVILLPFLLSFQATYSQTKKIEGDTVYWFKRNKELQKTLELKDFEKSTNEFNFRFWNQGQVIEITKDSSIINGVISNYIYHTKKANSNNSETLSSKKILSPEQAQVIYNVIQNSGILNLASDKNIKNWKRGMDGISYIIEHSDKDNYWLKTYWTPSIQDSIPEAIIVLNLVKNFSDILNLQETYTAFKNDLPKKGCYNSGGMGIVCYVPNSLELGYSGATKLPFGFYSSYTASYIGKTKVDAGVALQYNFDNNGFHHLNFQTSKWNLFFKKPNISDFIAYNFQSRKLNIDIAKHKFQNHQIRYGLNLKKNIGVGIGFDYLTGEYEKIGGLLFAYKWFSKPNISAAFSSSIFDNQVNYKAEISKSFNFNYRFPIRRVSFGLAYEEFMNYQDLYFNFRVLL